MKLKSTTRHAFLIVSSIATQLAMPFLQAAPYYWDTNGATAGAGSATPSGTWDTLGTTWSTSPNGTLVTSAYTTTSADDLFFSAGVNATGIYGISLVTTETASSLTFQEGTATISGTSGVITLAGTGGKITVNNGATATIGNNTSTNIAGSVGLTKIGVGTLTLNGNAVNTFTGGLNVNGGTLALTFANLATPTDLVNSGNALGLGGGRLLITGKSTGTTSQTLGNVTLNSGGGSILGDRSGGTALNITLGTITTTASGGSLLVGAGGTLANAPVITTTSGTLTNGIYSGRAVFFNGTANTGFDWLTNTGGAGPTYTLSGLGSYTALALGAGTDTNNSTISASATTTGSRTTNSLKFAAPVTAQTLTIGTGTTLTIGSGGLLFTGASVVQGPRIAGGTITAGNGSGSYDLVVHQYNASNYGNIGSGVTPGNNTTISSIIANNGSNAVTLVKNGPGTLNLGGLNTFTGGIIVNQGDLFSSTAGALGNNSITFNANANFVTANTDSTTGGITLNNNSQVTLINNNSSFTVGGQVTGTGGLSIEKGGLGSITVSLNATSNDFTGPIRFPHSQQNQSANLNLNSLADTTTVGEGNITFGFTPTSVAGISLSQNLTYGAGATGPLLLNNRRIELATTNAVQSINNSSGQTLTINSDLLVSGTTGKALTLGGNGAGLSTFGGVISNNATPTTGSTVLAIVKAASASTVTLASVDGIQVGDAISGGNLTGGTTVTAVDRLTRVVTLSTASGAASNSGTTITTANVINSVSVTKSGTGTWVLSGANTYSGGTTISAGILRLDNSLALQNSPLETTGSIAGNGTNGLRVNAGVTALTLGGLNGNKNFAATGGVFTTTSGGYSGVTALTLNPGTGMAPSYAAVIANGATGMTLTKSGLGTQTLSGANTFTGGTTISGGILRLDISLALQNSPLETTGSIAGDGTNGLRVNTGVTALTLGGLNGNKNFAATGGVFTTASGGYSGVTALTLNPGTGMAPSYSGIIADGSLGMSLTKSGSGTQTLTGANTYTGATAINAGTLVMGDAAADTFATSGVTVASVATLGGSGTFAGTLAVSGNLAPGNALLDINTLNVGATTVNGGSVFRFDLASSGSTSDKLNITGAFNKGSAGTYQFDFMGSTPTGNTAFTLAEWTTTTTFANTDFTFTGLDAAYVGTSNQFTISGNTLQFTPVPEASNLLIAGLLGLGMMSRRRKQA